MCSNGTNNVFHEQGRVSLSWFINLAFHGGLRRSRKFGCDLHICMTPNVKVIAGNGYMKRKINVTVIIQPLLSLGFVRSENESLL